MQVREALIARKSVRAFLPKHIDKKIIHKILDAARHAPSGTNTQPWQVAVVSGETKNKLCQQLESTFRKGIKGEMDYQYYPQKWHEPYNSRRKACGLQMYSTLNIQREDKQRKLDQWAMNYRAFDAPVMLLFFIDKVMECGSFLDYGMFMQSLMLAATEEGLATCPQASLAEYPDIVKQTLNYPEQTTLICGMALGYENTSAPLNSYRTTREDVEAFTRFFN